MPSLYNRNPTVESAPMRSEIVLFNPGNGKFCLLNATAALLWNKLETPRTVQDLLGTVESHFESIDVDRASRDIEVALSQLLEVECIVKTQID